MSINEEIKKIVEIEVRKQIKATHPYPKPLFPKRRTAPLAITMLIHFDCLRIEFPKIDKSAQQGFLKRFFDDNLIYYVSNEAGKALYRTTPKGQALVTKICNINLFGE